MSRAPQLRAPAGEMLAPPPAGRASRAVLGLALALAACGEAEAPAPPPGCSVDPDCRLGELCIDASCVRAERLECRPGDGKAPKLELSPASLEFGTVAGATISRSLSVRNGGDCTLTLIRARIDSVGPARFLCPDCADALFPISVAPGRARALEVQLPPGAPGSFDDALVLTTDDVDAQTRRVPLRGISVGPPALVVTPTAVDFGYVPAGDARTRGVQVINGAIGTATLAVRRVEILPANGPFSVSPLLDRSVRISPARSDPSSGLDLTVRYAPPVASGESAILRVTPELGEVVDVPLTSRAEPPRAMLGPDRVELGALFLGASERRRVTLQNLGRTPLVTSARLEQAATGDLVIDRSFPAELRPGGVAELELVYTPVFVGPLTDTLIVQTNDPDARTLRVPIVGSAMASPDEIVSVEMSYAADSSSILDLDIRAASLILEAPSGQVCRQDRPSVSFGRAGQAAWTSLAAGGKRQRIVLSSAMDDGEYPLRFAYDEDCSSLPTALAATLLGIGTEALVDYLSEGEAMVDPTEVEEVITEVCAGRRALTVGVSVRIDGTEVMTQQIRLPNRGAIVSPLALVRQGARFTVVAR